MFWIMSQNLASCDICERVGMTINESFLQMSVKNHNPDRNCNRTNQDNKVQGK